MALHQLSKRKDIIIKPADKGGGITILTPDQYLSEANRQLGNNTHYQPLDNNPMADIQSKIRKVVLKHTLLGTIPKKTAEILIQPNPKPARFYMLPKLH